MDATISAHEPPLHTEQNKPRQVQTQISDNIIIKFFLYANNRLVCANRIDPREMRNINASIKRGLIDDVEKDWSFIYRCVLCWWLSTVLICQFYKHALNICNAMRSHRYPEDTNKTRTTMSVVKSGPVCHRSLFNIYYQQMYIICENHSSSDVLLLNDEQRWCEEDAKQRVPQCILMIYVEAEEDEGKCNDDDTESNQVNATLWQRFFFLQFRFSHDGAFIKIAECHSNKCCCNDNECARGSHNFNIYFFIFGLVFLFSFLKCASCRPGRS